jgi:CDP-4-dehydro-6-deoxyglucose reductase/ferredoxin-NAD(P)+ reductase (naphthalene dioxygenase ferredoxin-specific)
VLKAGVAFPHNCQLGNCGACKCELVEGDVLELPSSEYALNDEERSRKLILACRTQAWGDCTVRMLDADETVLHPSRVMRCVVTGLTELTHDIKKVELSIASGGPYSFSAGQHARLKLGPGITERSYSMANRPDEANLEFFVRQVPGGQASGFVFTSLRSGAEVTVSGPFGNAYLRDAHRGPILAVAGGSGMAPIKSIVDTALRADPERDVRLYFGVRDERDVYLEPWLVNLAERHARLRINVVLSQPNSPTARRVGLLSDVIAFDIESVEGLKAYVAGPPPLVEATQRQLEARGMAVRDIHADAFYDQTEDAFNLP